MKQRVKGSDPAFVDMSIEEFDALDEVHEFSREYKKRKKKMLREYKKSLASSSRYRGAGVAAAVAALFIACIPIMAHADADNTFFGRIWGNLTKENIASHTERIYDEQHLPHTHIFPEREYVTVDPDRAKELLGGHVSYEPIVKELGDTTLTILSYVSDGQAAIVEFTLETPGGVNAFQYSQLDNEYHGASFTHDVDFWFHFPACAENIYVDLEKSTKELLHCYNYMTMDQHAYDEEAKGILLEVYEYPCTRGELFEADEHTFDKYLAETKISNIIVHLPEPVETAAYVNPDGGITSISPLSMKIDMDTGLGLEEKNAELYDQQNIYYVSVNYKDETNYIVVEHNLLGRHACEVEKDNSSSISFDSNRELVLVFNRLVDIDTIASITVNETNYIFQKQ